MNSNSELEQRLITKSNILVRSKYHLNLIEMRLLLCVIAQLNHKEQLDSTKRYYIHAQQYADMFGIQQDSVYKNLKEAIDTLYGRTIKIRREGSQEDLEFRWIQSKSYVDKKGMVSLMLSQDILPYLSELQSQFTQYFLNEIKHLDTSYSVRLYELAKSYLSLKTWSLELDQFREIFDLDKNYRQDNIQNRVIKPSVELINKHTSLHIIFKPYRIGRAIAGYEFNVTEKKKEVPYDNKQANNQNETDQDKPKTYNWGIGDFSMLKSLNEKDPSITQSYIESLAKTRDTDVAMVLHGLFMEFSQTQ